MEFKYLVVDEPIGSGDTFTTVCETQEDANLTALEQWNRLSRFEQKNRRIFAGKVTFEGFSEDAIDEEDGSIDWSCWNGMGCSEDRCFDSSESMISIDGGSTFHTPKQIDEISSDIIDRWTDIVKSLDEGDSEDVLEELDLLGDDDYPDIEEILLSMCNEKKSLFLYRYLYLTRSPRCLVV